MSNRKSDSGSFGFVDAVLVLLAFLGWFVWRRWVGPWWGEHGGLVGLMVWWAGVGVIAVFVGIALWRVWSWWAKRSGRVSSRSLGDGWEPGDRDVFAVVPAGSSRRGRSGLGQPRRKVSPALEFWPGRLRDASELPLGSSGRLVRAMWARVDGRWVWGVSVPREIGQPARRVAGSVWPDTVVERWPVPDADQVSDSVPIEEGGGTVVRRFLVPQGLGSSAVCSVCFS